MADETFESRYQRFREECAREARMWDDYIERKAESARREAWERSPLGRLLRWLKGTTP